MLDATHTAQAGSLSTSADILMTEEPPSLSDSLPLRSEEEAPASQPEPDNLSGASTARDAPIVPIPHLTQQLAESLELTPHLSTSGPDADDPMSN